MDCTTIIVWHVPDPATAGSPYWTGQFHNPYLAMGNNPINGTDPNGEWFLADSWLVGFVHGFFSEGSNRFDNAWDQANLSASNDAKIIAGHFTTDENKHGFFQKTWEIISRFTYQLPQTIAGATSAQTMNTLQRVNWVRHKYGATAVQTKDKNWGGITMGSYIIGDDDLEPNANNQLFQHEYGHYIQSQEMGFAFLPRVGIPSLLSSKLPGDQDFFTTEQDANRRGFLYFNKNVEGFYKSEADQGLNKGWNFNRNPLNLNGTGVKGQYVDYKNQSEIDLMNSRLSISANFNDYFGWISPVSLLDVGIDNYLKDRF